ncbi:glucose dehydrogenase [FAD, quinone]-like [Bacillus rossius redtenbacheri]|uniref:glucose dehydrogenase [FAD, quinone]-like n=1 Tax=Bacillus rossius redtenbacheri TaxID=93214 RepID=UPI002FDE2E25
MKLQLAVLLASLVLELAGAGRAPRAEDGVPGRRRPWGYRPQRRSVAPQRSYFVCDVPDGDWEACRNQGRYSGACPSRPLTGRTCNTSVPGVDGPGEALLSNLIAALLESSRQIADTTIYPPDVPRPEEEYDFVVVGAGTAGSVLANRLTEVGNWTVLVLEAGGDPTFTSEIPSMYHRTHHTAIDWGFKTEPQEKACLGMKNRQCLWPRGKVLGGTSVINSFMYVRGNRYDYDHWEALGNKGWGYKDLLRYFIKSEDIRDVELEDAEDESPTGHYKRFHKKGGLQTLERSSDVPPVVKGLADAARELGYLERDINGPRQSGFALQHGTVRDGRRCNTAKSFLAPAKDRRNLHVTKNAYVTKILIDGATKTATGVQFRKNGEYRQVRARKEVILAAGAIKSPHILLLSGVGPAKHLKEFGIPVVKDLAVGENLQDHLEFLGPTIMFNTSNPRGIDPKQVLDDTYNFFMHGRGPYSSLDILQFQVFLSSTLANKGEYPPNADQIPDLDYPDIQLQHGRYAFNDTAGTESERDVQGYTKDVYDAILRLPNSEAEIYIPLPFLQRPKSVGFIKLRSPNPFEDPIIDPKYLTHDDDIKVFLQGVRAAIKMAETYAMRHGFQARVSNFTIPACRVHGFNSDKYWECAVRHVASSTYHPAGTCKMGPPTDRKAVVDSRLKVYGVKGLRVIDSAIMPQVITGNTFAPALMIGEKGADLIKEDHGIPI